LPDRPVSRWLRPGSFNRFVVVGLVNTAFGWGLFPVLYGAFGEPDRVPLILAVNYLAAPVFSFFTHKFITFESRARGQRGLLMYGLFYGALFGLNLLLLRQISTWGRLGTILVQIGVGAMTMVIQYFMLKRWVFVVGLARGQSASRNDEN
jgi:putative flippase GtrA